MSQQHFPFDLGLLNHKGLVKPGELNFNESLGRYDAIKRNGVLPFTRRDLKKLYETRLLRTRFRKESRLAYPPLVHNLNASFVSRGLSLPFNLFLTNMANLIRPEILPAHRRSLFFFLSEFLKSTLTELREDPLRLRPRANELRKTLNLFGYNLIPIEAFNRVRDFEHFLETLGSLIQSKSHLKFELAISLIDQFDLIDPSF